MSWVSIRTGQYKRDAGLAILMGHTGCQWGELRGEEGAKKAFPSSCP